MADTPSQRSFWKLPEGKTGMVLLAAAAGIGVWKLNAILVWLNMVLANTLLFGVLASIVVAIVLALMNDRVRATAWIFARMALRMITNLVVDLDPDAYLKTYVEYVTKRLREFERRLTQLRQRKSEIQRIVKDTEGEQQHEAELAAAAERLRRRPDEVELHRANVGRLETILEQARSGLSRLNEIEETLDDVRRKLEIKRDSVADEVRYLSLERRIGRAVSEAVTAAKAVLRGDVMGDIYTEQRERIKAQTDADMGNLDDFLRSTDTVLGTMSLEQGADAERGQRIIAEWRQKADTLDTVLLSRPSVRQTSPVAANAAAAATSTPKRSTVKRLLGDDK